jgi:FkbM family methyltransferase
LAEVNRNTAGMSPDARNSPGLMLKLLAPNNELENEERVVTSISVRAVCCCVRSILRRLRTGLLLRLARPASAILQSLPPRQRFRAIEPILLDPSLIDISQKPLAQHALTIMQRLPPRPRAALFDVLLSEPVVVETPHGPIRFLNQSRKGCARAEKILTKEPDSLRWIDAMKPDSVFWDIGANIGVLTLYAATRGDLKVWAFEPAAVNYYNLTANCELNGLSKEVHCLLLGFSDTVGLAELNVSQLNSANSFSFKLKRERENPTDRQTTVLSTIDDFIARYNVPCPNYIKIDVPGLTREILTGAKRTLSRPEVRQIQIEVKEGQARYQWTNELLSPLGFRVVQRNMKRAGTVQGDLVFGRSC